MPETMRMMAFVKAPLGPRWGWRLGLLPGVLHALDRGGADLPVRDVLKFPGQAFRAQLRLSLDEAAGLLLHLPREAPGGPTRGRPFGQARQLVTMAQALNGAGRRRRRAGLRLDLGGTPGRMALGQRHKRLFPLGGQAIVGTLWPRAVIRQGTLQRLERAVAPFIEDAT